MFYLYTKVLSIELYKHSKNIPHELKWKHELQNKARPDCIWKMDSINIEMFLNTELADGVSEGKKGIISRYQPLKRIEIFV